MRVNGHHRRVYRYWNPVPADGPIEWIPDDEAQERFEALLAQAVARCLVHGPAGIYLSGGLDSSTLAMVRPIWSRAGWRSAVRALAGVLGEPTATRQSCSERLAAELGLSHVQFPYEDAVGPRDARRRARA